MQELFFSFLCGMKKIVIFASGSGSNAENIINYFKENDTMRVVSVFTNNSKAGVIDRVKKYDIPIEIFSKNDFQNENFGNKISKYTPDLIVLAGFLLKIPEYLITIFRNRIINIHPALLPKYEGKGMYGMNIHKAVFENKEKKSGITIHFVNEHYDQGTIIFQEQTDISNCASPEEIATKIFDLEYKNFPIVIEKLMLS